MREDDTPRVPGLLDQIPWRAMRRLRSFGVGVDGWESAPLASHDLGFLADLEQVWHASPVGTVIDGARGRAFTRAHPGRPCASCC